MNLAPVALIFFLAAADSGLDQGIKLFNDFEDTRAEATLKHFLEQHPQAEAAARAHLYLGLIAFNARDNERARREFAEAVRIAPGIEAPFGTSPKARFLFEQVQKETLEGPAPPLAIPTPSPSHTSPPPRTSTASLPPPTPSPAPIAEVPQAPPSNPSRAPAYVVGGIGLAGLIAGGIFGGLAASELSVASSTHSGITTAINANNQAGPAGLTADILFAAGGALAATGIVLWFIEAPSSSSEPMAIIVPVPQGAALQIGGKF